MLRSAWVRSVGVLIVVLLSATRVGAWWSATVGGNGRAASTSVAAATNPGVSATCRAIILLPQATVTWTATPSTFATGYDIRRSTVSGGPYTLVGSVTGRTTTTFSDTTVVVATRYYYVVVARAQQWSSPATSQVTVLTPLVCL